MLFNDNIVVNKLYLCYYKQTYGVFKLLYNILVIMDVVNYVDNEYKS